MRFNTDRMSIDEEGFYDRQTSNQTKLFAAGAEALAQAAADKAAAEKAAADKKSADAKAVADKKAADEKKEEERLRLIEIAEQAKARVQAQQAAWLAKNGANNSSTSVTPIGRIVDDGKSAGYMVSATPTTPSVNSVSNQTPPSPTKTAPIDTILFNDDSMSIEIMTDLIFEDIGGHELINIARNDIINGQEISYSPIKNLGLLQQKYNPNNILGLQTTSEKYFANFAIKFEEKVPTEGNGLNGTNIYFDETTGDLIIEGVNINKDELFEVEISLNGTIYEANFGATTS